VDATGTGFFYVDPAAKETWRRKATIKRVAREAWAQLTDPHRGERRKLGQLYAASMASRESMKSLETHIEELKRRHAHHDKKASEARQLAQDHVSAGRGDEAGDASEQESFHTKLALDYEQQIDRAGRDASRHREAYNRLKKEHTSAADSLALLDSKATGKGRCIPVGPEDAKLSGQGRRLLFLGMFVLLGIGGAAGTLLIHALARQPAVVSVPSVPVSNPPTVEKEPVKNNMVSTRRITPISSRKGGELLLWNKLGSDLEISTSEVGVDGAVSGAVKYGAVQHGNGVALGSGNSRVFFNRPFGDTFPDAGCIEFWWKAGHDENISTGSHSSERQPLYISSDDRRPDGWPSFQISVVCGSHPSSYLNKTVIGMGIHDKQIGQNVGVASTYDFNFRKGDLIHLAIAWDKSWSPARLKVYFNGDEAIPVTSDAILPERLIDAIQRQLPAYSYDLELHRYSRRRDGAASQFAPDGYVDNLKIWNVAKSDFSDRFVEGVGGHRSDADLRKGLIAHYPFNGNAKDEVGKQNDGVVYGASSTKDRFSKAKSAYLFDGVDDYIDIGAGAALKMTNAVSISVWINADTVAPIYQNIISDHGSNEVSAGMGKMIRLARSILQFHIDGVYGHGTAVYVKHAISTNTWYHIVGTYDRRTVKLYVNGELVDSKRHSKAISSNPNPVLIGKSENGEFFSGVIDDVMIYDRALTSAEVRQLYDQKGLVINQMAQRRGLFFVAGNDLYRMNMDGTDCVVAASGVSGSRALVADSVKKMIYMTTWEHSHILGYDVAEGGAVRQLHTGIGSGGQGLGYDPELSKFFVGLYYRGVYSLDAQQSGPWQHIVKSSQLAPMVGQRGQLQLDVKNQHVYFRSAYNGNTPLRYIWRVNYDGTGLVKIIGANGGDAFALDLSAGHVYFTDLEAESMRFVEIKRANLDGTDSRTILKLPHLPYNYCTELALDLACKKMYLSLTAGVLPDGTAKWEDRAIGRANLDGSDFEILWQKPGIGGGVGLAIFSR
jgi:hypothetical protein